MAKSMRSKSRRKSVAIKCSTTFKPVTDARVERIAAREALAFATSEKIPSTSVMATEGGNADAPATKGKEMSDSPAKVHKHKAAFSSRRGNKKTSKGAFHAHGLTAKDISF